MNHNIKNLWFNKRTEKEAEALKNLATIFDNSWIFHEEYESLFLGTYMIFYKDVNIEELESKVEMVNKTVSYVDVQLNYNEHIIEVKFKGDE